MQFFFFFQKVNIQIMQRILLVLGVFIKIYDPSYISNVVTGKESICKFCIYSIKSSFVGLNTENSNRLLAKKIKKKSSYIIELKK